MYLFQFVCIPTRKYQLIAKFHFETIEVTTAMLRLTSSLSEVQKVDL